MNRLLLSVFLIFTITCFSQTQHEIHKGADKEYQKVDAELNNMYQKILTEYRADTIFIDRLKKAQQIWVSYRDAVLEMKFPIENKQYGYGSVYPTCVSIFMKELTEERIAKLKVWIHGIEEGDMCSGSVKTY